MSHSRSKLWKSLPAAVVAVVAMSASTALSFEAHASRAQWQVVAGTESDRGVGESGALFVVGAGLAILAGSLRKLMHRWAVEPVATPGISAASHSRT
jgi:hypothetical protein